jgi:hypothetical protein
MPEATLTGNRHRSTTDGTDTSPEVVDLVCQRLMSRWGVSEKTARGMIAIELFGVARTKPPGHPRFRGYGQRRHSAQALPLRQVFLSLLDGE